MSTNARVVRVPVYSVTAESLDSTQSTVPQAERGRQCHVGQYQATSRGLGKLYTFQTLGTRSAAVRLSTEPLYHNKDLEAAENCHQQIQHSLACQRLETSELSSYRF